MLASAMRRCFDGRTVFVVLPSLGMFNYCLPILAAMGSTRTRHNQHSVEFGVGCEIRFLGLESSMLGSSFDVRGVHAENTFWDHEAVRQRYNHIIQRYHEYD